MRVDHGPTLGYPACSQWLEGTDGSEVAGLGYRHRPGLLAPDLSMPVVEGLQALSGILAVSPATSVVVYGGFEERGLTEAARELDAQP